MTVELKDGIFRVITDVTATTVVETKDIEGNTTDRYAFGLGDGCINEEKFIANATCDGKFAYIAKVNTDESKTAEDIKKMYGKALVKAKKYEPAAVAKIAAEKAAADALSAEVDALFA